MSEHPIQNMMNTTMEKAREMVDVNTIIGDPITINDGITLIPVSRITYGFASGGSDFPSKSERQLFGGGVGMGVNVTPVAFIAIQGNEVNLMHLANSDNAAANAIKMAPELFDKIVALFKKKVKDDKGRDENAVTPTEDGANISK